MSRRARARNIARFSNMTPNPSIEQTLIGLRHPREANDREVWIKQVVGPQCGIEEGG